MHSAFYWFLGDNVLGQFVYDTWAVPMTASATKTPTLTKEPSRPYHIYCSVEFMKPYGQPL